MTFVKVVLLLCLSVFFSNSPKAFAASINAPRPNIIFIFIDDIGWGDLSCYGSTVKTKSGSPITPNLDSLATQGMRFTQGYVCSPICSPSRTGVLTGIEPTRFGIHSYIADRALNASRNMANWVQPATVTSARIFQNAGYATGQFGKWHMGNGRDVNDAPVPAQYGFDSSLVAFEGNGDRLLYYNDNGSKYGLSQQNEDATAGSYEYIFFYEAAKRHTDAALSFVTNAVSAGKPFFIHIPYNDTHSPYNVPPGTEFDFDHVTSDVQARLFLSELHNLDKQIGRVAQAVDALGVGTNTLIVVVGDNGAPNDSIETLLNRNGGLRGGKGNLYEGGIRELFIVRCPTLVPAGRVNSTTTISTLDLLPTYCSLAGLKVPATPLAGEDMSDVLRGSQRARKKNLYWEYGAASGLNPASPKLAVRSGMFKFMREPDGTKRELYLIPHDHAEATNLVNSPSYSAVVSSLEADLMNWYQQRVLGNVGDLVPCGESNFVGTVMVDPYTVSGNSSPGTGFGTGSGVNYQFSNRASGAAAPALMGYRMGTAGGTSPREASDFSISNNRLSAAPRNGNCRFEPSADGLGGFDFGNYLAGHTYEISIDMDIDLVGSSYSQRLSLGLSDTSNVGVNAVDLGVQIGTDGAGGLSVFKRIAAGSSPTAVEINSRLISGLTIGTPITVTMRVTDFNANLTSYSSAYEILVNGSVVNTGTFRFNTSTTTRYLIFDVAAHEGPVHYDNLSIIVTGGGSLATCRRPILTVAEATTSTMAPILRLHWTAQPGLSVTPEWSNHFAPWSAVTNAGGDEITVTTTQGTIQWLEIASPVPENSGAFFRLRRN